MTALVDDLLAALSTGEKTRRGAGCEVDKHPTPSTRGTAESSWTGGRLPEVTLPTEEPYRMDAIRFARDALISGTFTPLDVAIVRHVNRVPWTLTNGVPCCDDCRHKGQPRHWNGVQIGESVCDVDGTCWEAEQMAHDAFRAAHGRNAVRADARFIRGVPVPAHVIEIAEVIDLPVEKLAKKKVGHPPKMTDEQIDAALDELANDPTLTITALARREWQGWGFKNEASCLAGLRRYRSLRDTAQQLTLDVTQEVAA